MMLYPMPELEIDRSRAGILSISPPVIGDLLRLSKTLSVVGARIGTRGEIELLIEGAEMPVRPCDGEPERVALTLHSMRSGDLEWVDLNWAHLPEQTWVLR